MIIGVPKEIKKAEFRVAATPAGVKALSEAEHKVFLEQGAGEGSGFSNEEFQKAGAEIIQDKPRLFDNAELILKVKEPLPEEYDLFHEDQVLFTYLHLAADKTLTYALLKSKVVGIAYETVQKDDGSLPLLAPMSEMAGRISPLVGSFYLAKHKGGSGKFIGGVPGVPPAKVVIIGGGTVGMNAAKMAAGMRAQTVILDINSERMRYLDDIMPSNVITLMSNFYNLERILPDTDLLIGAVLIPGAKAPHILTRKMLKFMREGSVIVDVAVDQGGCVETTHPTTQDDPVFEVDGVLHYCVANIPGAYPQTSTLALTNVTLPYVLRIANKEYKDALREDLALARGLNVINGKLICRKVAEAHNLPFFSIEEALN
ncbi:Alanine dehydrogenase [subsurface metagenome]